MHVCIHIYIYVYIHEHMIYTYAHYMYVHICRLHIYMCTRIYMCERKKVFCQKGREEEATEKQVLYLKTSYYIEFFIFYLKTSIWNSCAENFPSLLLSTCPKSSDFVTSFWILSQWIVMYPFFSSNCCPVFVCVCVCVCVCVRE